MRSPVSDEPMLVLELSGVEIDYCPESHGIWLDAGELEALFDTPHAARQMINSFEPVPHNKEKKIRCPLCVKKMEKVRVSENIIIDRCPNKHGLWFDEGELMMVLKEGHPDREGKVVGLLRRMFDDRLTKS